MSTNPVVTAPSTNTNPLTVFVWKRTLASRNAPAKTLRTNHLVKYAFAPKSTVLSARILPLPSAIATMGTTTTKTIAYRYPPAHQSNAKLNKPFKKAESIAFATNSRDWFAKTSPRMLAIAPIQAIIRTLKVNALLRKLAYQLAPKTVHTKKVDTNVYAPKITN